MDTPLRHLRNTAIDARRDQRMPRARVQTMLVRQPVSLKPMGNTVALTVPAEMPFVSRNVTVQTQMSGGMAGPDPSMRSRRLKGLFIPKAPAGRNIFYGLRGLGELARSTYMDRSTAEAYAMGDQTGVDADVIAEAEAIHGGQKLALDDPAPAAAAAPAAANSGFSWSKAGDIFSTVASAGTNVYSAIEAAKKKPGGVTNVANYGAAPAKSNTTMYMIIGGVAVVGLLAFLMLRKKSAPAAA